LCFCRAFCLRLSMWPGPVAPGAAAAGNRTGRETPLHRTCPHMRARCYLLLPALLRLLAGPHAAVPVINLNLAIAKLTSLLAILLLLQGVLSPYQKNECIVHYQLIARRSLLIISKHIVA
jgi:hypothetical protein